VIDLNVREVIKWIGIALILVLLLCIGTGRAYERIDQSGIAYLNETVDISSTIGWSTELVWAGRYANTFSVDNASIKYRIELPQKKEDHYHFYIDPTIFGNRLGWWYQFYGDYEKSGNNRAFYVKRERPAPNVNETANNTALEIVTPAPTRIPVEERKVSDYLIARGDPFIQQYKTNDTVSVWFFGTVDGIYDRHFTNGTVSFAASEFQDISTGPYSMLVITGGKNGQFDLKYDETDNTVRYFSLSKFKVSEIPTDGIAAAVLLPKVQQAITETDDKYTQYKVEIQDPYVEITEVDPYQVNDFAGTIRVRGYTNEIANKTVTLVIDEKTTHERNRHLRTFTTNSTDTGNAGSMRYFSESVPIIWSNMTTGQHSINASTPLNANAYVDFWIYESPAGTKAPNQTIKYIGGYEFVQTPTPEIITRVETVIKKETVTVTIPVTPSNEQVKSQQDAVIGEAITFWGAVAVIITMIVMALVYIRSVIKRRIEQGMRQK